MQKLNDHTTKTSLVVGLAGTRGAVRNGTHLVARRGVGGANGAAGHVDKTHRGALDLTRKITPNS
jgi:hypothetical protein